MTNPLERLRHHVTGAIERGEATAIAGVPARAMNERLQQHVKNVWQSYGRSVEDLARDTPRSFAQVWDDCDATRNAAKVAEYYNVILA